MWHVHDQNPSHLGLLSIGEVSQAELSEKTGGISCFADQYPLRILVAEDDYITRRVLVMFLEHQGYAVTSVENGQECFDEAMAQAYDLILSDIDMPQMNGLECAAQLRREGVEIPIVALSASSSLDPRQDCLRAGMDEYLHKPVPPDKLRDVLRDAFEGRLRKKA